MKYYINSGALMSAFPVPSAVADKHIKLAGAVQLKVLLCVFRRSAETISPEGIADFLSLSVADVKDALRFWVDVGILACEGETPVEAQPVSEKPKSVRAATVKPTREEIARRGTESPEIAYLLREAQQKLGRALRQSESSTLVWLHDDEGMSVSVLLMLLEFAISDGKGNIGYIERTALSWIDDGVEDIAAAERKINEIYRTRSCWSAVCKAFGIDRRLPSKREEEYALLWVKERGYSHELLREAYNRCIDSTGKLSMPYIAKILEKWHKDGVKTPADIKGERTDTKKSETMAAYDTSLFDKMLGAIDNRQD